MDLIEYLCVQQPTRDVVMVFARTIKSAHELAALYWACEPSDVFASVVKPERVAS